VLFQSVVFTYEWANKIPYLHIFLLYHLFGSLILILKVPPAIFVDYFLELLPFQIISLPDDHILLNKLMASVSNGFIVQLMSVSSESLDLMALLTPVDSIRENIPIVGLVALAPAEGTHLITA
jgi:hypothetical protein